MILKDLQSGCVQYLATDKYIYLPQILGDGLDSKFVQIFLFCPYLFSQNIEKIKKNEPFWPLPLLMWLDERSWNYLVNRWFYFFINIPKTPNWPFLQLYLEFSSTQRKSFCRFIPIWRRRIWMDVFTKQVSTKNLQLLFFFIINNLYTKVVWDPQKTVGGGL